MFETADLAEMQIILDTLLPELKRLENSPEPTPTPVEVVAPVEKPAYKKKPPVVEVAEEDPVEVEETPEPAPVEKPTTKKKPVVVEVVEDDEKSDEGALADIKAYLLNLAGTDIKQKPKNMAVIKEIISKYTTDKGTSLSNVHKGSYDKLKAEAEAAIQGLNDAGDDL